MTLVELKKFRHAYLIGIKGVGMTALAQCLDDLGLTVSGSDIEQAFITEPIIKKRNFCVDVGFDRQLPKQVDLVIHSSAHQLSTNSQFKEAINRGLIVLSLAQVTALLFNSQRGIAVAGVGGKSTTSAMVAWVLEKLAKKPSFVVGVGRINGLVQTGCFREDGQYFIAEADEYATNPEVARSGDELIPRFSYLKPEILVCTNLHFDHPDVYRDFTHTKQVFFKFFQQIRKSGYLIFNADQAELVKLSSKLAAARPDIKLVAFGTSPGADLLIDSLRIARGRNKARITVDGQDHELSLSLPGLFNFKNAAAALAVIRALDLNLERALQLLSTFQSTGRRLECLGSKNGILHFDDYAHHPSEISASFQALAEWYGENNILVAFQPHTFSRTKALWADFVITLGQIPNLILVETFSSAREKSLPGVTCQMLAAELNQSRTNNRVHVLNNYQELAKTYQSKMNKKEVFLTLGAGDLYLAHPEQNQYDQPQA